MIISSTKLSDKLKDLLLIEISDILKLEIKRIFINSIDITIDEACLKLTDLEKIALIKALALSAGNISKTALLLGITRRTVYSLLKKHSIDNFLHIHDS